MPGSVSSSRFAALARSSPWRWRTLRFTARWRRPERTDPAVRAWIRRPDGLRVERLDGTLLSAEVLKRPWGTMTTVTADGIRIEQEQFGPLDPRAEQPRLDADGLVVRRPAEGPLRYDDPMYVDYHWVAMLDPVELADAERGFGDPTPDSVEITDVSEVSHHGRRAWQATLRPTPAYDPRCSCCPLLFSQASEDWEAEAGGPTVRDRQPDLRYADAHLVRLDVATGVCVYTEELGGSRAGSGHDVAIEAVDKFMSDELLAARN
ncbi:hypothetical protein [Prauserella flavalba]|uniref:Uncharacterized protein n=1 Tax=Prauserella flavalba TaxID=1477506 RepID=A0A318LB46_9PSEU|nr:hypothetical protein [Prauserella flavalba]PXY20117.1 hypothetical protein BA062_33200 [Prauserella flavalba]